MTAKEPAAMESRNVKPSNANTLLLAADKAANKGRACGSI